MEKSFPKIVDLPEYREQSYIFSSREEAGEILAQMLHGQVPDPAIVLAIPAGGVPVARTLAENLGLPWDMAVVKKINPPGNTEFGYGAVAFDGTILLNEEFLRGVSFPQEVIEDGIYLTRQKVRDRLKVLRGDHPFPKLKGKTVILVDDGLATGFTLLVAIRAVKKLGAKSILVALPTAHEESLRRILPEVQAIYCANIRSGMSFAVADAYQDWHDVPLEEVLAVASAPQK